MDPALAILDRALKGDVGALSFLERTASIYIFDGTNRQPKICGAWDFLSQALTEVERYEARISSSVFPPGSIIPNLEGHVQLLATMSRRAARRSPISDQKLVEVCLSNAAYHGSAEQARHLIDSNRHMREREMGRLAAMVFDFSYHRPSSYTQQQQQSGALSYQSAFSNYVAMENLCTVVAANAISTGPHEFVNLVSAWIVPSIDNLPPYAVASVTCHLAGEAMGKGAPEGIGDALKSKLFEPVVSKVLSPMLQEAVRESDYSDDKFGGKLKNQRIALMVLKALERWSAATACSLVRIKQVCLNSNVNIIDVISDAMYSDSEMIMDSLAEFLETLLRRHTEDEGVLEGLSVAGSRIIGNISNANANSASSLHNFEQYLNAEITERRSILSELVSAIGLQRFRFNDRLANGDTGVCRSLTSIARSIAVASQTEIKSGKFQNVDRGFIDLLIKSVSHPSIHVCGIALEALVYIITPRSDLATKLLPMLQGKAIIPPSLVGLTSQDECDVDYDEFERFREHLLNEILISCYTSNRVYYIESCTCAVEEFCSFSASPQTAYQLEAALFCLGAVSIDASKRALLVNASPAAQEAAAKACKLRNTESISVENIAQDSSKHDEHLARTIRALCKAPESVLSNPMFLSQMCRFIGKYAKWVSKTPEIDVLDCAATLALQSFDRAAIICRNRANDALDEVSVSPFAESATALRNILSRSPHRFTSSQALSTLEKGWKSMYDISFEDSLAIRIDDKKALCTGITRVIAVLPPEQWLSSIISLSNPTIQCIEVVTEAANGENADSPKMPQIIQRMGEEISVLAIAIRTFDNATIKGAIAKDVVDSPVLTVLNRIWPCLNNIALTYSLHENISSSLSELLLVAVSLSEKNQSMQLLTEIHEKAITMINTICGTNEIRALNPIMDLVSGVVDVFGPIADTDAQVKAGSGVVSNETRKIRYIVEHLTRQSFSAVNTIKNEAQIEMLPAMFSICTSGIQRCPILFMTLSTQAGSQDGQIFVRSVTVAFSSIDEKNIDVARTAMLYLKEILLCSARSDCECSNKCKTIFAPLHDELVTKIIHGTCGNFPRAVLDPAAILLHLLLKNMEPAQAERAVTLASSKDYLRLGDKGRQVVISTLGKCVLGTANASLIMDLFDDIWTMHQRDDNGCESFVGGDLVKQFQQKYSPQV